MEQVINAIVLGSCYCLFALGLSLTWGTLNVLNLAHGAVFMFSAFTCYLITQRLDAHIPLWVLAIIAMTVGAVLELALDVLVFRPIRRRARTLRDAELAMLIASIGAATIPVTIAQQVTVDSPFSITSTAVRTGEFHFGSVYITTIEIVIVAVTLTATIALALWLQRTRNGRALRALAVDTDTSGLMGISQSRLSALALIIIILLVMPSGLFRRLRVDRT